MQRHSVATVMALLMAAFLTSDTDVRAASAQDRASREVFLSETRLETLKRRIEQRTEPTYSAWLDLKSRAEGLIGRQPHAPAHWYVPGYYRNADGHVQAKQGLQDDANAVHELALCWRMTGDDRYAKAAVRLIDGWVDTVKTASREDDSTLSFSYHFPAMIFGADLLASWPGFAADRQDAFRGFCRDTALPLNTLAQRRCNCAPAGCPPHDGPPQCPGADVHAWRSAGRPVRLRANAAKIE